ncbi:MAG TPA: hypothetical protein VHZ03_23260 [Trebonia sp.]|jgi:hypothetical protein|nr:hypothetical protein [Trebonia sp.]
MAEFDLAAAVQEDAEDDAGAARRDLGCDLMPGLLGLYLDNLGDDAPSVIARLTALESLALYGDSAMDEGRRLDDHALSMIADLPALEYLRPVLGGESAGFAGVAFFDGLQVGLFLLL